MTDREKFNRIQELRSKGVSKLEKDIAEEFGMTVVELRKFINKEHAIIREELTIQARQLKAEGKSVAEISKIMGKNESSVRLLLDHDLDWVKNPVTVDELKRSYEEIKKRPHVDVTLTVDRA